MRGFHVFFDHGNLPLETMTEDRVTELACFQEVEDTWNIPFYFTRIRSPWQKPSVENLNGLVRQFFPKDTNFFEIDPDQVSDVMLRLNQRPRKALCFHTPHEVLHFTWQFAGAKKSKTVLALRDIVTSDRMVAELMQEMNISQYPQRRQENVSAASQRKETGQTSDRFFR